jgi:hypothetical protein
MLPVSAGQRPAHRTFSGGGAGRSSGAGGMGHGPLSMDGSTSFPEYVRRIVDWKQVHTIPSRGEPANSNE